MSYMVSIILDVILPILIMIGSGILLQRKFNLDVKSFSKLILYYYIPALTFVKIYEAKISIVLLAHIVGFLLLQFLSRLTISSLFGVDAFPQRDVREFPEQHDSREQRQYWSVGKPTGISSKRDDRGNANHSGYF